MDAYQLGWFLKPVQTAPAPARLPTPKDHATKDGRPENDWLRQPEAAERRPSGDWRSAEQIINANPTLKTFLERHDAYLMEDALKAQVGDWTHANPDPHSQADAAYNLARVTNYLDNLNDRKVGSSDPGNQRIDGFREYSHLPQARSEAGVFKEFADRGYSALRHLGR